ncbi:hypothetical protein BLX42_10470 [Pseudomonas sp. SG-MS2]|nr:hypothetical protein BLX42_10470 [Pseudomonas sp. SG-MS2]
MQQFLHQALLIASQSIFEVIQEFIKPFARYPTDFSDRSVSQLRPRYLACRVVVPPKAHPDNEAVVVIPDKIFVLQPMDNL